MGERRWSRASPAARRALAPNSPQEPHPSPANVETESQRTERACRSPAVSWQQPGGSGLQAPFRSTFCEKASTVALSTSSSPTVWETFPATNRRSPSPVPRLPKQGRPHAHPELSEAEGRRRSGTGTGSGGHLSAAERPGRGARRGSLAGARSPAWLCSAFTDAAPGAREEGARARATRDERGGAARSVEVRTPAPGAPAPEATRGGSYL